MNVADHLTARVHHQVPWSDSFPDWVTRLPGLMGPGLPARLAALPHVDEAGGVWLLRDNLAVCADERTVDLSGLGAKVVNIAPRADGSVVVLARDDAGDVLARIAANGDTRWVVRGESIGELTYSGDAVWASSSAKGGAIRQVDLATGTLGEPVDIGPYRGRVWAGPGGVWRIQANDGVRSWIREPSGDPSAPAAMQSTATRPLGVLADGGPLLLSGSTLTWAHRLGQAVTVHWRGVARTSDGFAWATGSDAVTVHHNGAELEVSGLPTNARLIGERSGIWIFYESSKHGLFSVASDGAVEALPQVSHDDRLSFQASVDLQASVVTQDGELLVGGVDAKGAFVLGLEP